MQFLTAIIALAGLAAAAPAANVAGKTVQVPNSNLATRDGPWFSGKENCFAQGLWWTPVAAGNGAGICVTPTEFAPHCVDLCDGQPCNVCDESLSSIISGS